MAKGPFTRIAHLFLLFLLGCGWPLAGQAVDVPDFSVLKTAPQDTPLAEVRMMSGFDGTLLAFRQYVPRNPVGVMVLFHAAGLHSGLGMQHLAYHLAREQRVVVITPDLRGHGASLGPPGDAPRKDSYMMDMDSVLAYATYAFPDLPLLAGAHSSSNALLLNYLEWTKRKDIRGVLMLAPYLGPKAKLQRDSTVVKVHKPGMILNKATFGLACRHCKGVTFELPHAAKVAHRPLVTEFTVAAARGFSVSNALLQIRKLRIPYAVFCGSKDELLQGGRTKQFFKLNGRQPWMMKNEILRDATHLSILYEARDAAGAWVSQVLAQLSR